MTRSTFRTVGFVLATAFAALLAAAQAPSGTIIDPVAGTALGNGVAGAGDVDGDGINDFIAGAPFDGAGRADVYSGRTHALIRTLTAPPGSTVFGAEVDGVGDVNGDGFADVAVAASIIDDGSGNFAKADVYSGFDGSLLHRLGAATGVDFATAKVAGIGDASLDGVPDILLGRPDFSGPGAVELYSGADGSMLLTVTSADGSFGESVSGVGDVDGDGRADFIVGQPSADNGALMLAGRAEIRSGLDGSVLHAVVGQVAFGMLGAAAAATGDVTGDGVPDAILGASSFSGSPGYAVLVNGATGVVVRSFLSNGATRFGAAVGSAGFFDGDLVPDVVVGAHEDGTGGQFAGRIEVFSGATGVSLGVVTGSANDLLGFSVGALDGGADDFLATAFLVGAPSSVFVDQAYVQIYQNSPARPFPGSGADFVLRVAAGGQGSGVHQLDARAGDVVTFHVESPFGSLAGVPASLAGQAHVTGALPPGVPGFPEVHLSGNPAHGPIFEAFGLQPLPAAGVTVTFAVPPGLSGISVIMQGFGITPLAPNGIFMTTDASLIDFRI